MAPMYPMMLWNVCADQGEKTLMVFFSHLDILSIILPRQARDGHKRKLNNRPFLADDMATLESIREKEGFEWKGVYSFRTKEDAGHEPPWLCYLKGENPSFPVEMLQAAMAQVFRRSEQIRQVNQFCCSLFCYVVPSLSW